MKRIIAILVLAVLLIGALTGCSVEAPPKIKEGRFNFSITYEQWGEAKTVSGVYVCKYEGLSWTLEGGDFTRGWSGHVEGVEGLHDTYYASKCIYNTEDGGEVMLYFGVFAPHFMGEPDFADSVIEPELGVVYTDADNLGASSGGDATEIEELYGIKILDYHYDAPVKNTFAFFG